MQMAKTGRTPTRNYQLARKIGETRAMLDFLVGGFHFINTVEHEGFRTVLKAFSCNPNLSAMDLRSASDLVHEALIRAHKRLR